MIKFILIYLLSLPLFAGVINLNFSNKQLINSSWNLTYAKNQTSMLMLPMDVNFTDIQASLDENGVLYLYTNEQTPDLLKIKFGVNFVGLIKITKTKIIYAVVDDTGTHTYSTYAMLSNYLINTIGEEITDKSKKSIFLKSYVPYLEKIKANGLYKILPQNSDFTFKVVLPNVDSSNIKDGNSTSSNSVPTPPTPPTISVLTNFN